MRTKMVLAVLAGTMLATGVHGEGQTILISPTRLVVKARERSAEAAITNVTNKPLRYKVELVDQVMTASGTTLNDPDGFEFSAKPMLTYMPKVVDLPPGKRQTVRIMVKRPAELPDGDYHTHMIFSEIIPAPVSSTSPTENSGFKMELGMSYTMGIPLVVQQGVISSSVSLVSATLVRNDQYEVVGVRATLHREGNAEGNAKLMGTSNGSDVLQARNVRIYREANTVELNLPLAEGVDGKKVNEVTLSVYPIDASKKSAELGQLTVKE